MKQRFRSGGLAAWSIHHPVGISMLALCAVVLGFLALQRLGIDLLPRIIYPEIVTRIVETGVPARIMEDQVTRQLEEQLAITENAIQVQSRTTEGQSSVTLSFPYGSDIDTALRDASTRLDRAKRFITGDIEPPILYKRDPSQIPVLELIASSTDLDSVQLRTWADYTFSKWFLNLPGVAAVEVGGGLEREIQVIANQERLAGIGLDLMSLADIIQRENKDTPGGRLLTSQREISARTTGRFESVDQLADLILPQSDSINNDVMPKTGIIDNTDRDNQLRDVAEVFDSHEDERIRIRLNGVPGVKLSMQKQPQANTVAVVDQIMQRLSWLREHQLIPDNIQLTSVSDQSTFVRHALKNASLAAVSGAVLAMLVIYLFLGSLKRTLIIGTAIPIGILVTFVIMQASGLTLNIMTLGGLALGMGLLIDSTIVMLENITRHQSGDEAAGDYAIVAAAEVNSPIVASTATNLAAVLPFLLIGGLTGLLFKDLIITISSAMLAALIVALTLVPSLGSRIAGTAKQNHLFSRMMDQLVSFYSKSVRGVIAHPWLTALVFCIALIPSAMHLINGKFDFLPKMDEGSLSISIKGDAGIHLDTMNNTVAKIETLLLEKADVETIFSLIGGRIFGRTEIQTSSSSSITVQLTPVTQRGISTESWADNIKKEIAALNLTGFKIYTHVRGVRGIRMSSGDDDISLRVQGKNLEVLRQLGDDIVTRLKKVGGIRNLEHTYEDSAEELSVNVNRQRAADLGIRVDELGNILRIALDGMTISEYIDGDREFDIRLRLPRSDTSTPEALENLLVGFHQQRPVRLHEVASINRGPAPTKILHDQQQRIVEVSASLNKDANMHQVMKKIHNQLSDLELPDDYFLYDGGSSKVLKQGQQMGAILLILAIFLVFVVMAVQYESLLNPLVIIFCVPFTAIGVATGLWLFNIPISMPVWLGMIMLAGIVVNNAIMLVEQIEIEREHNHNGIDAIVHAAGLRLRPILMTTLTTVCGMLPLAIGWGEGAEMLKPLAIVIVCGLSFSMLVSLLLIPVVYRVIHLRDTVRPSSASQA